MSNTTTASKPRIFNKYVIMLMCLSLITSFGYSMVSTQISSYSTDVLGASLSFAGIIAGAYSFAALCMRPVAGFAADVMSKRDLCLYSTAGIFVIMALYAVVPTPETMLAARIIHGVCFGIGGTANLAMASEFIPKERLSEGLGYYGLGQILSQAFGPGVGNAVHNLLGYRGLFLFISAFTLLGVLLVLFFFKSEKVEKPTEKRKVTVGNFIAVECLMYSLTCAMFSLCNGVVNAFLKQFAAERSINNFSYFFTVCAVVMFLIRTFAGRYFDRIKLLWVVDFSLIASTCSMILVGRSFTLVPLLIGGMLKALGQGGGQITLQSACIKQVDPTRIGIATSTYYIGADVGNTVGPILGGAVAQATGSYESMFYVTGGLLLVMFVLFNFYETAQMRKAAKKEQAQAE